MKKLDSAIVSFFREQDCVIVSTIDEKGFIHNSCKGIVAIRPEGKVYLLDLYRKRTYTNLLRNPIISISAVDEYEFLGWCLKGRATLIPKEKIDYSLLRDWERKISSRVAKRIIKNIQKQRNPKLHPEISLPQPEYLIEVEVKEVVDLKPNKIG